MNNPALNTCFPGLALDIIKGSKIKHPSPSLKPKSLLNLFFQATKNLDLKTLNFNQGSTAIQHHVSSIMYPASSIQYQASSIQYPAPSI